MDHDEHGPETVSVPQALRETAPWPLMECTVRGDWIDYNGHMTEHRYLQVFGETTDALLQLLGIDRAYIASGRSFYTVETHLRHLAEAREGNVLRCSTQVLHADDRKLHVFHALHVEGSATPAATAEHMLLHVDAEAGRAVPVDAAMRATLQAVRRAHAELELPDGAGRSIGASARK